MAGPAIEAESVAVNVGGRRIISDVSCAVRAGELIGIMGGSGAGKSTLLATLTGYAQPNAGRVLVSGLCLYGNSALLRGQIGFVPQDDIVHPSLTVWQALWYSSRLRLRHSVTDDQARRRVFAVIQTLGLLEVIDTRIGSAHHRGISGGQRKRVNVAMELITDPPVLVLDEPTSGLSSVDALKLMKLLRRLADSGKAVILTIHQPSLDVIKLMDGLVVLAKDRSSRNCGQLVWFGPAYPDAARFFEPGNPTPDAEAVMRGLQSSTVAYWKAAYAATSAYKAWVKGRQSRHGESFPVVKRRVPPVLQYVAQWAVLLQRGIAVKAADSLGTGVLLAQSPLIALLVVIVLSAKTRRAVDPAAWTETANAITTAVYVMVLAAAWLGCSATVREIVTERSIFKRERTAGVGIVPYAMSKVVLLCGITFVQCFSLMLVIGLGCGLQGNDWSTMITLLLVGNVAGMIGLCVSATVRSGEAAAGSLPVLILPMVVLGGILVPLKDLGPSARLLADLNPTRWAFERALIEEASQRPKMQIGEGMRSLAPQIVDMAEVAFPCSAGRCGDYPPAAVLGSMWIAGIVILLAILIAQDHWKW